jgi:hypothetical protein
MKKGDIRLVGIVPLIGYWRYWRFVTTIQIREIKRTNSRNQLISSLQERADFLRFFSIRVFTHENKQKSYQYGKMQALPDVNL